MSGHVLDGFFTQEVRDDAYEIKDRETGTGFVLTSRNNCDDYVRRAIDEAEKLRANPCYAVGEVVSDDKLGVAGFAYTLYKREEAA